MSTAECLQITSYWIVLFLFYIRGSVHPNSRLKKSNGMQRYEDIYLLLNYSNMRLKKLAPQIVRSVPESATTVLCTPNDWRDWHPKHVE